MVNMAGTLSRLLALVLSASSLTACEQAQGTEVGPRGGVVVSEDGRLTVEIPAGALDTTVDISIHAVEDGPGGDGTAVRAYAIEPLGTALVLPARVEYDWTVEAAADALTRDRDVDIVDPALVIERGPQWRALPDHAVDHDAGYVSGSVNYLGVVAIVD